MRGHVRLIGLDPIGALPTTNSTVLVSTLTCTTFLYIFRLVFTMKSTFMALAGTHLALAMLDSYAR